MASTKEKMQRAQQFIKEKRYDEARAILRTVNHDKAYEWLDRLDKIAPVAPIKQKSKAQTKSKTITVSSKSLIGKSQMDNTIEKYQNEGWQLVEQTQGSNKNSQVLRFEYEMSDKEIAAEKRRNRNAGIGCLALVFVCIISMFFSSPSSTPSPTNMQSLEDQNQTDANLIETGFAFTGGIDIVRVDVVDGRDAGGERGVLITYRSSANTQEDLSGEWGTIFGVVGGVVREFKVDLDAMTIIVGDVSGNTIGTVVAQMSDVTAFINQQITAAEFFGRLTIVNF